MSNKIATVLIVDDNDMMRGILRGMLRGQDYNVIGEARNGHGAIEMTERLKPDIVCLDVMMPEMNGLEAMVQIKLHQPETEIVIITGNADSDTVQQAIMGGASGFIVKPFNAARVLDTLERVTHKLLARSAG